MEVLRKNPRARVSIPAILSFNAESRFPCCILNLSERGFGIEVSEVDLVHIQKMGIKTAVMQWTPVPTMEFVSWELKLRRVSERTVGFEISDGVKKKKRSAILKSLLSFHLK